MRKRARGTKRRKRARGTTRRKRGGRKRKRLSKRRRSHTHHLPLSRPPSPRRGIRLREEAHKARRQEEKSVVHSDSVLVNGDRRNNDITNTLPCDNSPHEEPTVQSRKRRRQQGRKRLNIKRRERQRKQPCTPVSQWTVSQAALTSAMTGAVLLAPVSWVLWAVIVVALIALERFTAQSGNLDGNLSPEGAGYNLAPVSVATQGNSGDCKLQQPPEPLPREGVTATPTPTTHATDSTTSPTEVRAAISHALSSSNSAVLAQYAKAVERGIIKEWARDYSWPEEAAQPLRVTYYDNVSLPQGYSAKNYTPLQSTSTGSSLYRIGVAWNQHSWTVLTCTQMGGSEQARGSRSLWRKQPATYSLETIRAWTQGMGKYTPQHELSHQCTQGPKHSSDPAADGPGSCIPTRASHEQWVRCADRLWWTDVIADDWYRLGYLQLAIREEESKPSGRGRTSAHTFGQSWMNVVDSIPSDEQLYRLSTLAQEGGPLREQLALLPLPIIRGASTPLDKARFWEYVARMIESTIIPPRTGQKHSMHPLFAGSGVQEATIDPEAERAKPDFTIGWCKFMGHGLRARKRMRKGEPVQGLWGLRHTVSEQDLELMRGINKASIRTIAIQESTDQAVLTLGMLGFVNDSCAPHATVSVTHDGLGASFAKSTNKGVWLWAAVPASSLERGAESECELCPASLDTRNVQRHDAWRKMKDEPWFADALAEDWARINIMAHLAGLEDAQLHLIYTHSIGDTRRALMRNKVAWNIFNATLENERLGVGKAASWLRHTLSLPQEVLGLLPGETPEKEEESIARFWDFVVRFADGLYWDAKHDASGRARVRFSKHYGFEFHFTEEHDTERVIQHLWGTVQAVSSAIEHHNRLAQFDNATSRSLARNGSGPIVHLGPVAIINHACEKHLNVLANKYMDGEAPEIDDSKDEDYAPPSSASARKRKEGSARKSKGGKTPATRSSSRKKRATPNPEKRTTGLTEGMFQGAHTAFPNRKQQPRHEANTQMFYSYGKNSKEEPDSTLPECEACIYQAIADKAEFDAARSPEAIKEAEEVWAKWIERSWAIEFVADDWLRLILLGPVVGLGLHNVPTRTRGIYREAIINSTSGVTTLRNLARKHSESEEAQGLDDLFIDLVNSDIEIPHSRRTAT